MKQLTVRSKRLYLFNYLNIEWIDAYVININNNAKRVIPRDIQIERYQKMRDEIDRIIKYLKDDKIGEYINDEVLPVIKNEVLKSQSKAIRTVRYEMDEFVSCAMEVIYDMMSRGFAVYGFKKLTGMVAKKYIENKIKQPQTVEFNERIM